jgi:hypothetical protein
MKSKPHFMNFLARSMVINFTIGVCKRFHVAPPSSLMDSTKSPKVKIAKGEGVGARSLTRNILRVEGMLELWDGD